jgi:hypothetical protein
MRLTSYAALLALGMQSTGGAAAGQALADVPTVQDVLGFELGARPASYEEIVRYLTELAAVSDRVLLSDYGATAAGRKLPLLTVSSARNLARLNDIQQQLARLSDARDERSARLLVDGLPAVVWMGYGIHGDEVSASDAALAVAHRLVAGNDDSTREILDKLVVHIDPVFNADGSSRTLAQLATFSRHVPSLDPQDVLVQGQWPPGRGNHYFFDLNRDALYTVQPEARARVAAIARMQPQFLADAHEMGVDDTHLFAVPAEPFNPNVPREVHATWHDFAVKHAEAFDERGISYYTRSWNEVFYPGYFDILLAYHGGTPMIYEQAANGGVALQLPNGRERSYAQSVDNHVRSSMIDLATAAANRSELLRRWWSARRTAAAAQPARTWLMLPGDDWKRARVVEILRTHGVQMDRLVTSSSPTKLRSIWGTTERTLPAGTLRVASTQPLGAVVRNLFDFHTPMAEDFLERERHSLDTRGTSLLFDVTAWDAPHAFDAEIYWAAQSPSGNWQRLAEDAESSSRPSAVTAARYGYLYKDHSLQVTARLLASRVKIRVATEAFVHRGVQYAAGDFLIRNDDQEQPAELVAVLRAEQARSGAPFVATESARIMIGPDLGGPTLRLLKDPRIAMLVGTGLHAPTVGEVWHLLDVELDRSVALLDLSRLSSFDLSRYDTIVVPDGDGPRLEELLKHERLEVLKAWMSGGGTLIALRGAAQAIAASGEFATRRRQDVIERYPPLVIGRGAHATVGEDFVRGRGMSAESMTERAQAGAWPRPVIGAAAKDFVPASARVFTFPAHAPNLGEWLEVLPESKGLTAEAGAMLRRYLPRGAYLRVDLLAAHWLVYGMSARVPALFREDDALIVESGAQTVGRYGAPGDLALAGLVWPEATGYVANTAYVVRERVGAGQLVLFANDPVFRGYSLGTRRTFVNALLLGASFRSD